MAEINANLWDRAANAWRRLVDTATIEWDTSTKGQVTANVPDGGIDTAQLADGAVTADKIANDVVPSTAADISYDNASSGLSATDVQDAIDEVEDRVDTLEAVTPGLILLDSGTVDDDATLDIDLTGYTTYRAIKFVLSGFVPATNDRELWMRFSSNGGASFDASGYSYALDGRDSAGNGANYDSTSASQIVIAGISSDTGSVSNVANEGGADVEITLHNQTAVRYSRVRGTVGYYMAAGRTVTQSIAGSRETAQDTDAIRFLFESGNIASGSWALYGYA